MRPPSSCSTRNRLIAESEVYRGTLSRAAVEPRAIFKEALLQSASGFVLFHTHPSGDPSPSAEEGGAVRLKLHHRRVARRTLVVSKLGHRR